MVNSDTVHPDQASPLKLLGESGRKPLQRSPSVGLRAELGLTNGIGMIVGCIIGAGIFISPTGVIRYAGSTGMALVVWVACGVLSMMGAMCYAELGTMIPKSGGDYAYLSAVYGPLPAFIFLWMCLLVIVPTHNAIQSLTFANYLLEPFFPDSSPPENALRLIAAAVLCKCNTGHFVSMTIIWSRTCREPNMGNTHVHAMMD